MTLKNSHTRNKIANKGKKRKTLRKKNEKKLRSAWSTVDDTLIIRRDPNSRPAKHIVAFDWDGTLTYITSGRISAKNSNDYSILCNEVVTTLNRLFHDEDKSLVIFSNQADLKNSTKNGKKEINKVLNAIDKFVTAVGVPIDAILATRKDKYRKPGDEMFYYYLSDSKKSNKKGDIVMNFASVLPPKDKEKDLSASIVDMFVGNEVGRSYNDTNDDKMFAKAVGISISTPEDFFKCKKKR